MSSVNLLQTIQGHLNDVAVLNKRIIGLDDVKNELKSVKEKVISSDFELNMALSVWEKLFSSSVLMDKFKRLSFDGSQITILLEYSYIKGLMDEDWIILKNKKDEFFEKLEKHKRNSVNFNEFLIPLLLDFYKNERNEEEFMKGIQTIDRYVNYYQPKMYKFKRHEVVQKMIHLLYATDVQIGTVEDIADTYQVETEDGLNVFMQLTDYILQYQNQLSEKDNLFDFICGYKRLANGGNIELIEEISKVRSETFADDLIALGGYIYAEIPEKVLKRLLHKTEDIMTVLFSTHSEWVSEVIENYKKKCESPSYNGSYEAAKRKLTFVQKIVLDNKKSFIKLYKEYEEELELNKLFSRRADSVLLHPRFYELVNINTLNKETLKKSLEMALHERKFEGIEGPITFQEFEFMNDSNSIQRKLYLMMNDWKVDDKIRVLKTLPSMNSFEGYRISEDVFIETLMKAMKEKGFEHYTNYMKSHDVSRKSALLLHLFSHQFKHVLDEIETDIDVDLLMKHVIKKDESLLVLKTRLYRNIPEIQQFTKFLGASDEFILNNKKRFYEFYEKGLMHVVGTYKGALNQDQKQNLRLLAKAEVAGKLKEVKYRNEDYAKEIGIPVTSEQKSLWKIDTKKDKGKYLISETSDFNHLIRMGEIPTRTCMNWNDGSYRQCLLSIFDLNKKMVVVQKKGKVVARAILRLTKVNEVANGTKKDLNFVDVEQLNENETNVEKEFKGERLVLFLERLYTSITGKERDMMEQEIISLVKQKARDMKVEMYLAKTYTANKIEKRSIDIPVFVSRSKNGTQYLDSFGGEDESGGGKYYESTIYKIKL